jgi:hypothetical protein
MSEYEKPVAEHPAIRAVGVAIQASHECGRAAKEVHTTACNLALADLYDEVRALIEREKDYRENSALFLRERDRLLSLRESGADALKLYDDAVDRLHRADIRVAELEAAMELAAADELAFIDHGEDGPIVCLLNMNDVFAPAADAEPIAWAEVCELRDLVRREGWPAAVRWVAQRRGESPRPHIRAHIDEIDQLRAALRRAEARVAELEVDILASMKELMEEDPPFEVAMARLARCVGYRYPAGEARSGSVSLYALLGARKEDAGG